MGAERQLLISCLSDAINVDDTDVRDVTVDILRSLPAPLSVFIIIGSLPFQPNANQMLVSVV